jgi:hypothetical protein
VTRFARLLLFLCFALPAAARADTCSIVTPAFSPESANYDESKVPPYQLPPLLTHADGSKVTSPAGWRKRRQEILRAYRDEIYGHVPQSDVAIGFAKTGGAVAVPPALQPLKPIVQNVSMTFSRPGAAKKTVYFLVVLPRKAAAQPVPAILFLNFTGNLSTLGAWPTEDALKAGVGLIYLKYTDLEPDQKEPFASSTGIRRLYAGSPQLPENGWGAISAWAFGASRILDYVVDQEPRIDPKRVAVAGHSRLGKTALWAAAQDERFALAISNNSGELGAALSRRQFGETVHALSWRFPNWFSCNFRKYPGAESKLPVDQHMLIALLAPRPVYVASAEEDLWADPRGEYLSLKAADEVYRFLGVDGLGSDPGEPALNVPVGKRLRYHRRSGQHEVTRFDWARYLDFVKTAL